MRLERMKRNTTIILTVWVGLLLIVAVLSVIVEFRKLALCVGYQTTAGSISEKLPNNHLGIGFSYRVSGHEYRGRGYAGQIGRPFDTIQPGDTVTVFYDGHRPASYTLEVPSVLLTRTVGQIIAACAILPAIGIYMIRRYGLCLNLYGESKTTGA